MSAVPEQLALFYVIWRPFLLGSASLGLFALAAWERPLRALRILFGVAGVSLFLWAAFPYLNSFLQTPQS
ncbi:MAG: hypothetical protein HFF30_04710 [Flavonifractor sp.]|nr:hypothetical protein [Flavonifractor sp.]